MKRHLATAGLALAFAGLATGPALAQAARKLVINHFVSDPNQKTIVYVTDFDGTSPAVSVDFYDMDGNIMGQRRLTVPENATVPVYPYDVVKRRAVGSVRVESREGSLLAEYWQIIEDRAKNFDYSVGVPSHPASGDETLIVQHYVSDPEVTSVIYLTNPQAGPADVTLEFHDNGGNVVRSVTQSIPSNGSVNLKPYDLVQRKTYGNVHISSPGVPITGEYWQLVDTKVDGKEAKYTVAVPLQSSRSY